MSSSRVVVLLACGLSLAGCTNRGTLSWDTRDGERGASAASQEVRSADYESVSAFLLSPSDGQVVDEPVLAIHGLVDRLPAGAALLLVADDQVNYFPQFPPARVDSARGTFAQHNVRLATGGKWTLHLAIATPDAVRTLEQRAARGDWSGLTNFPEGVYVVHTVAVEKK